MSPTAPKKPKPWGRPTPMLKSATFTTLWNLVDSTHAWAQNALYELESPKQEQDTRRYLRAYAKDGDQKVRDMDQDRIFWLGEIWTDILQAAIVSPKVSATQYWQLEDHIEDFGAMIG